MAHNRFKIRENLTFGSKCHDVTNSQTLETTLCSEAFVFHMILPGELVCDTPVSERSNLRARRAGIVVKMFCYMGCVRPSN